jgi:NAD(P)-dependent dehydrogenase (short-subunit alcohol dehydrogenase family)
MKAIFSGKHAVVTGGGRGIGAGIAAVLAERGARVSIVSRHAASREYVSVAADVGDEASVRRAFAELRTAQGPIEILVNNAGISDSSPLLRTSLELFDRILRTNLVGTFLCTREAATDMASAKWGRILNVASIAGLYGAPYISAYCASKHGVVGFTRAIATEFSGLDITVNAICPGYTETDMMHQAIEKIVKHTGAGEESARATLAQMNPEGRLATVDEVARVSLDLMASGKNGVAVVVPGGAEA